MGRRTAIGTLVDLLAVLLEREECTLAAFTHATELSERTVASRMSELEREGLAERLLRDGELRWRRGRRLGERGVLLDGDLLVRARRLLLRLPVGGHRDEVLHALGPIGDGIDHRVRPPRWSAEQVLLLDALDEALRSERVLRVTARVEGTPELRAFAFSPWALSLGEPAAVDGWDHRDARPRSLALQHVIAVATAANVAFVRDAEGRVEAAAYTCEVHAERLGALVTAGVRLREVERVGEQARLEVFGAREEVVRFVLANAPEVSALDGGIAAIVRERASQLTATSGRRA
jgi:hypothetical protein